MVCTDPGPAEEDELYEMYINQTNMVYRVKDDRLQAVKDYWGQLLKHSILSTSDVSSSGDIAVLFFFLLFYYLFFFLFF